MRKFEVTFNELAKEKQIRLLMDIGSESILAEARKSNSSEVRLLAAKDSRTKAEDLVEMLKEAREEDEVLVNYILSDDRLSEKESVINVAIKELSSTENSAILRWMSFNTDDKRIIITCLKTAIRKGDAELMENLLYAYARVTEENEETLIMSREILEEMVDSPDLRFRKMAASTASDENLLELQLKREILDKHDGYLEVIKDILNNENFFLEEEMVKRLSYLNDPEINNLILSKMIDRKKLMNIFRVSDSEEKRQFIMKNRQFMLEGNEWLEFGLSPYKDVREWVAKCSRTPSYILTLMYQHERDPKIRYLITENKNSNIKKGNLAKKVDSTVYAVLDSIDTDKLEETIEDFFRKSVEKSTKASKAIKRNFKDFVSYLKEEIDKEKETKKRIDQDYVEYEDDETDEE